MAGCALNAARGRRGVASVEFAFVLAAMIVVLLASYDLGNYVLQEMKLTEAAQAGGQFAIAYPSDAAGITCAVQSVLCPNGPTGQCPDTASCPLPTISVTGPSTDGSGTNTALFVTVALTQAYTPVLLTTVLTSTNASYVVRIQ